MLYRAEGADRGGNRPGDTPARAAAIAAASTFSMLWRPRMGTSPACMSSLAVEYQLIGAQAGAGRDLAPAAEPLGRGGGAPGIGYAHRVVGVQDGEIAGLLGFEETALGRGIILEGMVAVQVVLRDVEGDADVGAKLGDGLQLEAGEFQDVPAIRPRGLDHGGDRGPDIPAHLHGHAGLAQDVADQAGGGGFSVRAGIPMVRP